MSTSYEYTSSSSTSTLSAEDVQVFGCDTWPLHYACRVGNLEHVRFLVDVRNYCVNQMDCHDASPLYLAALCGHNDICQFLLERGAKCDPNGDAARVFYVALTPELRNLLREWSLTAASRDPWLESLSLAFREGSYADCSVTVAGTTTIKLHRVMLQSRYPHLLESVSTTSLDGQESYELKISSDLSNEKGLLKVLEYIYTGILEARDLGTAQSAMDLAHRYGLDSLRCELEAAIRKMDVSSPFRCDVDLTSTLRADMRQLARLASTPHAEVESLEWLSRLVEYSDMTLQCHDSTWSLHKFRLASSAYFERALSGGFKEAQSSLLDLSHMVESPDILPFVIHWMYCDEFLEIPSVEMAVEILELGLVLICPRLSAYTANAALIPAVVVDNAMDVLQLARLHDLERLEERCVDEIGAHFERFANSIELLALLQDEAMDIKQGGDVRVIDVPLAAEIRRAIKNQFPEESDERAEYLVALQQLVDKVLEASSPEQ